MFLINWLRKKHYLHCWGPWTDHGTLYQRRQCVLCKKIYQRMII